MLRVQKSQQAPPGLAIHNRSVTSEPYIGHLGLGGVGGSKALLESALRSRHIKWITNAKVSHMRITRLKSSN